MRARWPSSVLLLALLAACGREQSFDERYDAQAANIQVAANGMEAEVAGQIANARAAEQALEERGQETGPGNANARP